MVLERLVMKQAGIRGLPLSPPDAKEKCQLSLRGAKWTPPVCSADGGYPCRKVKVALLGGFRQHSHVVHPCPPYPFATTQNTAPAHILNQ